MAERSAQRRLVACCDGTWNTPDRQGHTTNVVRLLRSVKACSDAGITQVTYYHPGVGTGDVLDRAIGGGTGVGLSENVRSAYAFFVDNYRDGDEIFLFGFSRGAYTARSVAGMMAHVGLLRKHHMENFDEVWDYYRQREDVRRAEEQAFLANFPDRVPGERLTIRCIGVWDTVGALGIPNSRFCQKEYQFHDTTLGPGVEYAFQALAIDEHRKPFAPAIWKAHPTPRVAQQLEQVWFPGVHADIGGGYSEHVLSDASLFWMACKIAPLLELDLTYLAAQADRRQRYAAGTLHKSLTWSWRLTTGSIDRPICETDPSERIHESAFMRLNEVNGHPVPAPYGTREFRQMLNTKKNRMARISNSEQALIDSIMSVLPEMILKPTHRRLSFCDRLLQLLGGYQY